MQDAQPISRSSNRGIVLISTLVSIILLVGVALIAQGALLRNVKTIKHLAAEERQISIQDAVLELARPLIVEALLDFKSQPQLPLNSTPLTIELYGDTYHIVAQDVGALVQVEDTPIEIAKQLLPTEMLDPLLLMREQDLKDLPLRQRFVLAGGDLAAFPDPEKWLTTIKRPTQLYHKNFPVFYETRKLPEDPALFGAYQPGLVSIAAIHCGTSAISAQSIGDC